MKIRLLLCCSLLGLAAALPAQTLLRFSEERIVQLSQVWSVQIQQQNSSEASVYLIATLREKNAGEVYRARSNVFQLGPGVSVHNLTMLQPVEVLLNRLPDEESLPNGYYWVQISLFDAAQNRELVNTLLKTVIDQPGRNAVFKAGDNSPKSALGSSGTARLQYYVNTPRLSNSPLPELFLRGELQSGMRVFQAPIQVNALYSTENGGGFGSPVNQVGFSLDQQALKAQAMQWLERKLSDQQLFDSLDQERANTYRTMLRDKRFPQYQAWKEKLDALDIESLMHERRQLEALETTLDNKALRAQISELEALKTKYKIPDAEALYAAQEPLSDSLRQRMGNLFRLEKSWNYLQQQRSELTEKTKNLKQYEALYKKVKAIERRQSLGELIENKDDLRAGMKAFGRINRLQTLLLGIDELQLGACYPYFSNLSLNGVKVNGAHIAYTAPNRWHIGLLGGRRQAAAQADTGFLLPGQSVYRQLMLGVQAGLGRPEGNHIYLHHLRAADYGISAYPMAEAQAQRGEDFVSGLSFQFQDRQRVLWLNGELNQSLYSPDKSAPELSSGKLLNFSRFLGGRFRTGSALDWSYQGSLRVLLPEGTTQFSASVQQVGPGYRSFGMPFLMQDVRRYDVRARQDFWDKRVQLSAYYKRDYDQTMPLALAQMRRTFTTGWGGQLRLRVRTALSLSVDYAPYAQQRSMASDSVFGFRRRGNIFIAAAQYQQKLGEHRLNLNGSWVHQQLRMADSLRLYRIHALQLSAQYIRPRLIIALSGQYSPREQQEKQRSVVHTLDLSATLPRLTRTLQCTFGGQYLEEPGVTSLRGVYFRGGIRFSRRLLLDYNYRYAAVSRQAESALQHNGWLSLRVQW